MQMTIDGKEVDYAFYEKVVNVIQTFNNDEGEMDFVCPKCEAIAHVKYHKVKYTNRVVALATCKQCNEKIMVKGDAYETITRESQLCTI